jgi:hypothetical protein
MASHDIKSLSDELLIAVGGLTDAEKTFLSEARQGQCLMLIGDKNRIVIENYISTDEKKF